MTCRLFIATLSVIACVACERSTPEKDASIETPYAARFATQKPAFVRTAAAATHDMTRPVETFADPQYTAAQSAAGADVYKATCARCHAPTQWKGGTFAAAWQDRRLSDFYDLVSVTMPQDAPGSLTPEQYVNATAYVLELAGFASGPAALKGDTSQTRHARLNIPVPKT